MNDLSYYSLLVAVKGFEPIDSNILDTYCALPNKMDIDDLFLTLTSGVADFGERDLNAIIKYCNETADMICVKYGIDESVMPIYRAYLIPLSYKTQDDSESDVLVQLLENACAIEAELSTPEWNLREGLKYRLMALYSWVPRYFFKLKSLLADVQQNREEYDKWLNKVR